MLSLPSPRSKELIDWLVFGGVVGSSLCLCCFLSRPARLSSPHTGPGSCTRRNKKSIVLVTTFARPRRTPSVTHTHAYLSRLCRSALHAVALLPQSQSQGYQTDGHAALTHRPARGAHFAHLAHSRSANMSHSIAGNVAGAGRNVSARAVAAPPTPARSPASTGKVTSPMTLTEKILANKRDAVGPVKPGDNIWTKVDKLLTHDVCGPGTFGIFEKEFGENAKARRPHDTQENPCVCSTA